MSARTTPRRIRRAAVLLALGAGVAGASVASAVQSPPNVTVPAVGGEYTLGDSVPSQFSCDATADSCVGPATVDTSTLGPHTFTATATDADGPVSTDVNYTVVLPPVVDGEAPSGGSFSTAGATRSRTIGVSVQPASDPSDVEYALTTGTTEPAAYGPLPTTFDLSDADGTHRVTLWVRDQSPAQNSAERNGVTVVFDRTPPAAPTFAPFQSLTSNRSPSFSWTGSEPGGTYAWRLSRAGGPAVTGSGPQASFTDLVDDSYTISVTQSDAVGPGPAATRAFTLDATAPVAPTITSRPAASGTDASPTFAWDGEAGGGFTWRLLGAGGAVVQGPADTASSRVTLAIAPGSYTFQVRQTDAAGNAGAFGAESFAVTGPSGGGGGTGPANDAPAKPRASTAKPPTVVDGQRPRVLNARRLTPRAAARFASVRPTLRWKRHRGAMLYNLQIFRVDRSGVTKVLSAFPTVTHYRVPKGRLKVGRRYVWRVWPYMSRSRSTRAPLGVSFFDVKARARR